MDKTLKMKDKEAYFTRLVREQRQLHQRIGKLGLVDRAIVMETQSGKR